ncbi:MAG: DUF4258 domain-containing protein [Blastocatellia bacterium]|nr:DUF4258 domain-containing protein [Blastocatellia bacterium]
MTEDRPPPPSYEDVLKYIAEWYENDGEIVLSWHLKKDRAHRNITTDDCKYLLKTGKLAWPPIWDDKHQNYKYEIDGQDLDGDALHLVFAIDYARARIIVITGY